MARTVRMALEMALPHCGADAIEPRHAGISIREIADPVNPKQLSDWKTGTTGTHRNSYPGGRHAYLSAGIAGFSGDNLVFLDIAEPHEE